MVAFLCMLSLQVLSIARRLDGVREHGRFALAKRGCRGTELGEYGRRARIELDSRSERERKSYGRYRRQRDSGRIDRGRKSRQYAVDRVIRDALLGGMVDRRDAFSAALRHDRVAVQMRQRVQLCRLLCKDQRGGKKQVTQSVVRHGRRYRQHGAQVYYKSKSAPGTSCERRARAALSRIAKSVR